MKYSLRSLMITVTLAAVVLGLRVEYLRRMAAYHQAQAVRWREFQEEVNKTQANDSPTMWAFYHEGWAQAYKTAVFRPWRIVRPEGDDL